MGKHRKLSFSPPLCDIMETVWSEPSSPGLNSPRSYSSRKDHTREYSSPGLRDSSREFSPGIRENGKDFSSKVRDTAREFSPGLRDTPREYSPGLRNYSPGLADYSCSPGLREYSPALREYSPLRESPRDYFSCLADEDCQDELFLLPDRVLNMDSDAVRDDLSKMASSFVKVSPHNSLDSTDSGKSLRLLEDSEGLHLARASDGCRTLWICK